MYMFYYIAFIEHNFNLNVDILDHFNTLITRLKPILFDNNIYNNYKIQHL